MPAKTKKEKLLAQQHRYQYIPSRQPTLNVHENIEFIRRDLGKTLLLGGVAIGIELALYIF